jgi:hypothetical protein
MPLPHSCWGVRGPSSAVGGLSGLFAMETRRACPLTSAFGVTPESFAGGPQTPGADRATAYLCFIFPGAHREWKLIIRSPKKSYVSKMVVGEKDNACWAVPKNRSALLCRSPQFALG